ncbi:MAG: tyrosine-type recombinase/integrase [Phycisphaerae bacterium]|nr:tyrosine-type recombinase/integrase [Phycisphaerae bacterium]
MSSSKKIRPNGLKYVKNGYYKLPDGREVIGLKRRPDGRFYAASHPSKTFGKDPAEAIFRYKQWLATEGKEVVRILEAVDLDWEPEWLGKREPKPEELEEAYNWLEQVDGRVKDKPETIRTDEHGSVSLIEVDSALYWTKVRDDLLRDPKEFARKVGVPEIGYLERLKPPPPPLSLVEAGRLYLTEKQAEMHPKHWENVSTYWKEFCDLVGVETLDDLNRDAFAKYASIVKAKRLEKSTKTNKARGQSWVRARFSTVATVVKYAFEAQKISPELYTGLRQAWLQPLALPKQPKGKAITIKPAEFAEMLKAADDFMKALLLVGVNAAFYPVDFKRLEWEHVDLEHGTLSLRREKMDSGSVQGVTRHAVLWKATVDALTGIQSENPFVFAVKGGGPIAPATLWERFRTLCKKAKVKRKLRPEDLRNTAGTIASRQAPSMQYKVLMGHVLRGEDSGYVEDNPFYVSDACKAIGDYLGVV